MKMNYIIEEMRRTIIRIISQKFGFFFFIWEENSKFQSIPQSPRISVSQSLMAAKETVLVLGVSGYIGEAVALALRVHVNDCECKCGWRTCLIHVWVIM